LFNNEPKDAADAADVELDENSRMEEAIQILRSVAGHLIEDSLRAISNIRNEFRRNDMKGAPPLGTPCLSLWTRQTELTTGLISNLLTSPDEAGEYFAPSHPPQSARAC
jgi:hypothetical protein